MNACETCGRARQYFELHCVPCALASDIPDNRPILQVWPSLRAAFATFVKALVFAVVVGAIVLAVEGPALQLLTSLFSGALLIIAQIVLLLLVVVAGVGCVTVAYVGYSELRRDAGFYVSKTNIEYREAFKDYETIVDEIAGGTPTDTRFVEKAIELDKIRFTRVKQDWLGRLIGTGDVEVYTDDKTLPAMTISGIVDPTSFRQKLELIRNARIAARAASFARKRNP